MMKIFASFATGLFTLAFATSGLAQQVAQFSFDVPNMNEEATLAGINHTYDGPWEFFVGGGVASFDCNGDRMPDLFMAGGTNPAQLFVNKSRAGGELNFEQMKPEVSARDLTKVLGVYPINIDSDSFTDLVVLRLGENLILKGGPNCTFKKANKAFGFDGGSAWSTAFAARWEAKATHPTLAFGNYVDRTAPGSPWGTCDRNILVRPTDDAAPYGDQTELRPGHCALSMLFTDWNKSGEPALRITNDRQYYRGGQEQLWRIPYKGAPRKYSKAQGWKPLRIWGMGIAEADLNQDGLPEYALTSMGDTMLQMLDPDADTDPDAGRPTYRDAAFEKQMTAHRPYTGTDLKPSTGWHTQFSDFNNDTRTDLFIAKGNVEAMPDFAAFDPDNMLLGGADGKFHEKGDEAGIALNRRGRGGAVVDLNADGMLDLVVINRKGPASLFRNMGSKTSWGHRPMGTWVGIELDNGKINKRAVGAKITVKTGNVTQSRVVQIGGGHASGQTGFIHFGLGVAERAKIRVQWPDGDWSHEYRVFANNFVQIPRGKPDALYWYPKR